VTGTCAARRSAAALFAAALAIQFLIFTRAALAGAEAGRQKAQSCASCHGPGGNSANPAVPTLAGQPQQFIVTQLFMFREGKRRDAQMSPFAANLSNADLNDLAAYFSAQPHAPPSRVTTPEVAAAGRRITEQNNCVECHARNLMGQQHIPRLAGQQADYLRAQLRGFKASTRFDMDGNMTSAAQALTDADIDVLADYLSGLGAP
jgi:cytochrome c553